MLFAPPALSRRNSDSRHRGITLMEVLISIGILSVGLTTVVALIPAGGSEARRAVVEDRRANLCMSAIHDAIVRGVLDTSNWNALPTEPFRIVIDPLGGATLGFTSVELSNLTATSVATATVFQGEDDLSYSLENSGEEDPPVPLYFRGNSRRLSEGSYTWLATLVPSPPVATGSTAVSQYYLLSVCACYKREGSATAFNVTAPATGKGVGRSIVFPCAVGRDRFRSLFPRGGVVFLHDTTNGGVETCDSRRIALATQYTDENENQMAEVMFDRPTLAAEGSTLYAIEGAVGVAEKVVRLEGVSPWAQ